MFVAWVEHARRGGASVVHVEERDARHAELVDDRVGVVDLVAAAERELHVPPLDAGVLHRQARRSGAHLDGGLAGEPAERVQTHPDDRDVGAHDASPAAVLLTGRKA